MLSDHESGDATILEPEKFVDQGWFDFDALPSPMFLPWAELQNGEFIENIKKSLKS